MRISVIGSGYVGLVTAVCFSELGHDVSLFDNDPAKLAVLRQGLSPIHEKYVPELLKRHLGGKLHISDSLAESITQADAIFVAVGTPPTVNGEADLSYVESVAREIAANIKSYKIVVSKSTVPVYTSEWVRRVMLLNGAPPHLVDVASNPEFLREGAAVTDFMYAERIVIGTDNPACAERMRQIYEPLLSGSYVQRPDAIPAPGKHALAPPVWIATTAKSAELIKYASNAFLAMKISFINAVAALCESVGADVDQVREGIGSDSRIGREFLNPGLGYGGSCFPKDLSAYRAVARESGYDFRLLEEVMRINNEQRERFLRKVRLALWTLKGKRIGALGLAFKGGTDDVRESPAIAIIRALVQEGCKICAYDPAATGNAREVLGDDIAYAGSAMEAATGADALLVLTDWDEFRSIDLPRLREVLRYPIVIDGRNLYSPETMGELGFIYTSVGRRDVPHEFANLRKSTTFVERNPELERTAAATAAKVP